MTYRVLSVYLLAFWAFFAFRTIDQVPLGYLHSWNQITSLSFVDSVRTMPERWYETRDVTTRVTWEKEGIAIDSGDRYQRFIVYEEFPLYHILAAFVADMVDTISSGILPGVSASVIAARTLSMIFFMAMVVGLLYRGGHLVRGERFFLLFLVTSSFPLVFYSTAPMSDVAMTCGIIFSCLSLEKYCRCRKRGDSGRIWFLLSVLFLGIATLFKSYAVVWMPALIVQYSAEERGRYRGRTSYRSLAGVILLVVFVSLPVFVWHFWPRSIGHSEVISHVFWRKLEVVFSGQIISVIWKNWFRYFGYLTGLLTLAFLVLKYILGRLADSRILPLSIPVEIASLAAVTGIVIFPAERIFLIFSLPYLFLSADKLPHHDYYFFPVVMLLCPVVSRFLAQLAVGVQGVIADKGRTAIVVIFIVLSTGISVSKVLKAQRVNSDVVQCAKLVSDSTVDSELIATWTDLSRYNSIAYISGRKAVNIEGEAFHPNRYRRAGASVLVIDLPKNEYPMAHEWAVSHGVSAPYLTQAMSVRHGGPVERICALYRLSGKTVMRENSNETKVPRTASLQ
ncbi:MAG: hypothetical protein PHC51_09580 [bacterium]|nr:hypothetical protein [bacterium]